MSAIEKYNARAEAIHSLLCVGLDSDIERLPWRFLHEQNPQYAFNRWIIEQTHSYTAAYKPNIAFYEARGSQGYHELQLTIEYLRNEHPAIFTICDAKRADIGNSNRGYVNAIFGELGFDAITLHPYLGHEALQPFLDRRDKGCIILCRTSNPGANELQDLLIGDKPLWKVITEKVYTEWNANQNCMLVVGATYPAELREIREIIGDMTVLVPGIGAQGGDIKKTIEAGLNSQGKGVIINASRSVIFAEQPGIAAKSLRDEMNRWR